MTPTIAPEDVLVERLRCPTLSGSLSKEAMEHVNAMAKTMDEAADAITGLQDRVERLEGALLPFAREADNWLSVDNCKRIGICSDPAVDLSYASFTVSDLRKARAALIGEL